MSPADPPEGRQPRTYADLGGSFTPLFQRLQELGVASRVVHVGMIAPRGRSADFVVDDPKAFLKDLQRTGRFCEDTAAGRILHRGKASWREDCKARSLHVAVDPDGRVLAHLDRFSPVARARRQGFCRYSPGRIVVHNAARVFGDLIRFVFGHRVDCAPMLLSLRRTGVEAQALPTEPARSAAALPEPARQSTVPLWESQPAGGVDRTELPSPALVFPSAP